MGWKEQTKNFELAGFCLKRSKHKASHFKNTYL